MPSMFLRGLRPTFSVFRTLLGNEAIKTCVPAPSRTLATQASLITQSSHLQQRPFIPPGPVAMQGAQITRGLRSIPKDWVGGRVGTRTVAAAAVAQEVVEDTTEADRRLTKEVIARVDEQVACGGCGRLFAVVFVQGKQHLVTPGDLVVVQGAFPPTIGDSLRLEKVLCVGGQDFTVYGRPVLQAGLAAVEARVVEKTLTHCRIYFYNRRRKNSRFKKFNRETHTLLRITRVELTRPLEEIPEVEGVDGKFF